MLADSEDNSDDDLEDSLLLEEVATEAGRRDDVHVVILIALSHDSSPQVISRKWF